MVGPDVGSLEVWTSRGRGSNTDGPEEFGMTRRKGVSFQFISMELYNCPKKMALL